MTDKELHKLAEANRKRRGNNTLISEFGPNYNRLGDPEAGGVGSARQRMLDRAATNPDRIAAEAAERRAREAETKKEKARTAERERLDTFARLRGFKNFAEYEEDLAQHRSPTSY